MKRMFDVIINDAPIANESCIVHLDMTGVTIGDGTFYGMLFKEVSKIDPKLMEDDNAQMIIYIDNIMQASDRTLLNPGLIGILVRDAIECSADKHRVIMTNAIESAE